MKDETVEAKLDRLARIDERLDSLQAENTTILEDLVASHPGPLSSLEEHARYEAEAARVLGRQEVISELARLTFRQTS